jgi:hypothetical protein
VLQATFEPGRVPSELDLALLRAAAALASVGVHFGASAGVELARQN